MTLEEMKKRLAVIEDEQNRIDAETEKTVASILGAFHHHADRLENGSYRFLSSYSRLSAATLHAWFSNNQPEGKGEEDSQKTGKKTDGPRMINVIRGARLINIALPDVLDFVKEDPLRYDEMSNSWNVFIQNMLSMRKEILGKRNNALNEIGWVTSQTKKEEKDYITRLTSQAGKISKYYTKIIKNDSKDYEEKEGSMHIGKLLGNPKCELKTILTVTNHLNGEIEFSKWFRRWGADETICKGQEQIALYDDEKEKLPIIAPYITNEKYSVMMAIRVGNLEEMESNYADLEKIPPMMNRARGPRTLTITKDVEVQGYVWRDQVCISNWKQLLEKRFAQKGDLLFVMAVKRPRFPRRQLVVFNLSKMTTEEVEEELKGAEKQQFFKNIWLNPQENSRKYDVRPDNESIEEFYRNDPLCLYHSEDDYNPQMFYSPKFSVEPDNHYKDIAYKSAELSDTEWEIISSNNQSVNAILEAGPQSEEVKKHLLEAKARNRLLEYVRRMSVKDVQEGLVENPVETVRVARFAHTAQGELRLSVPFAPSLGKDIVLSRKQECDFTIGVHKQRITEFDLPLASWAKEYLVRMLADKAGNILRDSHNPRFDDEFIYSYQERICKAGIDELIKKDRLWLQVQLPTNLDGRVEWYWHVDGVPRI